MEISSLHAGLGGRERRRWFFDGFTFLCQVHHNSNLFLIPLRYRHLRAYRGTIALFSVMVSKLGPDVLIY
jgi:hypothetical protein